jgi:hypothetical protein
MQLPAEQLTKPFEPTKNPLSEAFCKKNVTRSRIFSKIFKQTSCAGKRGSPLKAKGSMASRGAVEPAFPAAARARQYNEPGRAASAWSLRLKQATLERVPGTFGLTSKAALHEARLRPRMQKCRASGPAFFDSFSAGAEKIRTSYQSRTRSSALCRSSQTDHSPGTSLKKTGDECRRCY